MVECYRIDEAHNLWNTQVETEAYEGLVFRHSVDKIHDPLVRFKRIITEDLRCVSFTEGMGKHEGRLGAIQGVTKSGTPVYVGGGFSDDDRQEIWNNQPLYVGKWFEVEARARFVSGSLRHPQFVRWREDK
jgi:ATP-dependent DNA ligase